MKRLIVITVLILGGIVLSACDQSGFVMMGLVTEGEHTLENRETIRGSMIIAGGKVTMDPGANINGDIYMLDGILEIDGEVNGNVSFIGGNLKIGPEAVITGDLNIGGTQLNRSPEAMILGVENRGSGIQVPSMSERTGTSLLSKVLRSLAEGIIVATIAYLLIRYQHIPLQRVSEAIGQHPVVSLAMGILVAIIGVSLLITIAFTILLIPVTLIGLLILAVTVVFGWVACALAGAGYVIQRWKLTIGEELEAFLGTLIMTISIVLLSRLSFIGSIALLLFSCLGLGAVFLTRFGLRKFEPATSWGEGITPNNHH